MRRDGEGESGLVFKRRAEDAVELAIPPFLDPISFAVEQVQCSIFKGKQN